MNKVYQVITDKFIEALEQGVIPWEKPWNALGMMPRNAVSKNTYSGVNVLMLAMVSHMKGYQNPFWVTYKQASTLGGSVKTGEKSAPVTFWKVQYYHTETNEKLTPSQVAKMRKDSADKHKIKTVPILRYYNVFNIEQCEDIDDSKLPEIAESTFEHEPDEHAQSIIDAYVNREGLNITAGPSAFYTPTTDSICMPPMASFPELSKYYSTFFHEMVHSTGSKSRLKRDLNGNMRTDSYSKEELTAEIGASFLNHQCGFLDNTIENSTAYIQSWLSRFREKDGPTYIVHAAARAEKAVEFIVGDAEGKTNKNTKASKAVA